ncbi:MAG: hypothetical protein WCJ97_04580 [Phycisphaerae bacterium]
MIFLALGISGLLWLLGGVLFWAGRHVWQRCFPPTPEPAPVPLAPSINQPSAMGGLTFTSLLYVLGFTCLVGIAIHDWNYWQLPDTHLTDLLQRKNYTFQTAVTFIVGTVFWASAMVVNRLCVINAEFRSKILGAVPTGLGCLIWMFNQVIIATIILLGVLFILLALGQDEAFINYLDLSLHKA